MLLLGESNTLRHRATLVTKQLGRLWRCSSTFPRSQQTVDVLFFLSHLGRVMVLFSACVKQ